MITNVLPHFFMKQCIYVGPHTVSSARCIAFSHCEGRLYWASEGDVDSAAAGADAWMENGASACVLCCTVLV